MLAVVRQVAESAVEEYRAALAGDQVVETIEYQDARGFLLEAQRLLSAGRFNDAQRTITAMLKAVPTPLPPRQAVMSSDQLQTLLKQL